MEELVVLVKQAQCGDLDAFGRIVRRFQDMAHGYAYSILGDFHSAEDAAQEAFIDAYTKLSSLNDTRAFPGWFRRIVFTHCTRQTRKKSIETVPLEEALDVATHAHGKTDMEEAVLEAVLEALRALPVHQREATTLFYTNGYSQEEIAEFLEVPLTTVQKRIHDSKRKLKQRMINMIEENLKHNAPRDQFADDVIAELVNRPRPLEIKGHPVQEVADILMSVCADYEYIEGDEVVETNFDFIDIPEERFKTLVYRVGREKMLRTDTTVILLQAMVGRRPPVKLVTYGRVFRAGECANQTQANVFHMFDALHIASGVTVHDMRTSLQSALETVLGPLDLKWEPCEYRGHEHGANAFVESRGEWSGLAGCAMLNAETLTKAGYDAHLVSGFSYGIGIERVAMVKYGIDDINELWQPPYLPQG